MGASGRLLHNRQLSSLQGSLQSPHRSRATVPSGPVQQRTSPAVCWPHGNSLPGRAAVQAAASPTATPAARTTPSTAGRRAPRRNNNASASTDSEDESPLPARKSSSNGNGASARFPASVPSANEQDAAISARHLSSSDALDGDTSSNGSSASNANVPSRNQQNQQLSQELALLQQGDTSTVLAAYGGLAGELSVLQDTLLHIQGMSKQYMAKIMQQEAIISQQDAQLQELEDKLQRSVYEAKDLKVRLQVSQMALMEERNVSELLATLTEEQAEQLETLQQAAEALLAATQAAAALGTGPPPTAYKGSAASNGQAAPAKPAAPPPPPPPPAAEVKLTYSTGWNPVFLHANIDNKGWTAHPGLVMASIGQGQYSITVPGKRIEFVLTDGSGGYDKRERYDNYVIDGPGTYRLERGQIHRV